MQTRSTLERLRRAAFAITTTAVCGMSGAMTGCDLTVPGGLLATPRPHVPDQRSLAEPPREFVDTTYNPPTGGTTRFVAAGGDIQAAIDAAMPGDIIELQAGAVWDVDRLVLPDKGTSTDWIYIRTSAYASLPPPGTRVSPADVSNMPTLRNVGDDAPVLLADFGAHHYRLVGIYFTTTVSGYGNFFIAGKDAQNWAIPAVTLDQLPTDITIDRCVMWGGGPGNRCVRGTWFDVIRGAVVDSYIYAIKSGSDAQAIGIFNSPGPYAILNNYLESTGENFMSGGEDPDITNLIPSDIEFRGNHCFKPLTWKSGHPSYAGYDWGIKNLFELKNAQRVLVQGNVFQNNWEDAQSGYGILFTVRNQYGTAPWSTIEDVTFVDNIIIDSRRTWNLLGDDDIHDSQTLKRVVIANNLARSGPEALMTSGQMQLITRAGGRPNEGLVFTKNTIVPLDYNAATSIVQMTSWPATNYTNTNVTWMNNVLAYGQFGVIGDGIGSGTVAMTTYWDGYTFAGNVLFGNANSNDPSDYPTGNDHPQTIGDVHFMDAANGDYRIEPGTLYDGKGADCDLLRTIETDVIAGISHR